MVDLSANPLVVNLADGVHRFRREGRQIGGGAVFFGLGRPLRAWDGAGHGVEHKNPAEGELGERHPGRTDRLHFFHGGETCFVIDAGKRFADVERFAAAIELAVVIRLKRRLPRELAGEKARGQRHTSQNADASLFGLLEEQLRRPLTEHVEDNLHALDIGEVHRLEPFFRRLDADAVVLQFAGGDQVFEDLKYIGVVVDVVRRAVELQEVDRFDAEILQAALDERDEVFAVVSFCRVRIEPPAGFGGDVDRLFALTTQLADKPLAAAVAIDVGCVDEVDTQVDRLD